jgi:hypothetical protein
MKHKWHKEIKAWADGAEIQTDISEVKEEPIWIDVIAPKWDINDEFRIKPEPEERYETIVEMPPKHKEEYLYVYYNYAIADYKVTIDPYFNFKRGIHQYIGKLKLEEDDK